MAAPLTAFVDHYAILGVDPKADSETIRKAFSAHSTKSHPRNGTEPDQKRFDEVKASFDVLIDPVARKAYDAVKLGPAEDELPPMMFVYSEVQASG
jgi:DnaJ-class molecular chaperone